jgi:hypothetical protein
MTTGIKEQGSAVGTANGYMLEDRGLRVRVPVESRIFTSPPEPTIPYVPGASSLEVKRQGREADHSPPTSVNVKLDCNDLTCERVNFLLRIGQAGIRKSQTST